jgi:hypothetical protein
LLIPKGIPLTHEEQERRRQEIFHQVIPILAKKGFQETSMQKIADAAYLEGLQANKNLFLKLSLESQRLKLESQKQIQAKRHAYQDMIRALIEEGIREGIFRQVNSLLAARLLIGDIGLVLYSSRLTDIPLEMLQNVGYLLQGN